MKKTSIRKLILLLPVLVMLTGLTALPANCLVVEGQGELPITMSLDKGPVIQAGDSVTVTLTPAGGQPPYTYNYLMIIYENDHDIDYFSIEETLDSSHTWTVGFGKKAGIHVIARDADQIIGTCDVLLEVQGSVCNPIKITDQSFSPGDIVNVGEPITYSVFAEGGDPPYTYEYELFLYRNDCWSVPIDIKGCNSSQYTYTVTGGAEGYFVCAVNDTLGRKSYSGKPLMFTILGDDSPPMDLSATQSIEKLSENNYRMTIQASVKAGALPVSYVCRWHMYKNFYMIQVREETNTSGAFYPEGDFDRLYAELYAVDADGWKSRNLLKIVFDAKNIVNPILSELIKIDLLKDSLRKDLFGPDWGDLTGQIDDIPELVSPPLPIPDVRAPELIKPELTKPKLTAPEIVKPEISRPGITAPQLPALQQPIRPKP